MSCDVAGPVLLHKLPNFLLKLVCCHALLIGDEVSTHQGHILHSYSSVLLSLLQRDLIHVSYILPFHLFFIYNIDDRSLQPNTPSFPSLSCQFFHLWTFFLYVAKILAPSISPKSSESSCWLFIWVYTHPYAVLTPKSKISLGCCCCCSLLLQTIPSHIFDVFLLLLRGFPQLPQKCFQPVPWWHSG